MAGDNIARQQLFRAPVAQSTAVGLTPRCSVIRSSWVHRVTLTRRPKSYLRALYCTQTQYGLYYTVHGNYNNFKSISNVLPLSTYVVLWRAGLDWRRALLFSLVSWNAHHGVPPTAPPVINYGDLDAEIQDIYLYR